MAGFYEGIAYAYDWIFPHDPAQVEFVKKHFHPPFQNLRILDVGCGTGSLALALAELGFLVTGIDADAEMIRMARAKTGSRSTVPFHVMDMLRMSSRFAPNFFDGVLCFGNTLVHLPGHDAVLDFLRQCEHVLAPSGKLLIQILHYDYILDKNIRTLPILENEMVRFEREYRESGKEDAIVFHTVLYLKAEDRYVENETLLFPLRRSELESLLCSAGFQFVSMHGDFAGHALSDASLPLVAAAVKGEGTLSMP